MGNQINIFWFRRDLRLHDNVGLYYALQQDPAVLPLFIFDKNILDKLSDPGDARVTFIQRQIEFMNKELKEFGSGIMALHDTPENVFKKLLKDYDIEGVYTNRDYEPYAIKRDAAIEKILMEHEIPMYTFKDQVIFEGTEILTDQKQPYKVFTPYKNKWLERFNSGKYDPVSYRFSSKKLYQKKWKIPTLKEMSFKESNIKIPDSDIDKSVVKKYDETRNFPAKKKGTTRIGIHLRFGTISIRETVALAAQANDAWLNELIWREFYMMILFNFPKVVDHAFKPAYDRIPWRNSEEDFKKWCDGKTGFPIVDAGMRELNNTGYMHNRVRMIVASFLTKHLLIDWRWGEAYFAEKLLDYELSSNNGGWQWAAGSGTDAQPYFRVFNPYSQADKFDPDNQYIKQWVPEFGTKDYPKPIVDHKFARQRAIDTYKEALNKS
jgi:deoxyribodipyrimidine photo-lyase